MGWFRYLGCLCLSSLVGLGLPVWGEALPPTTRPAFLTSKPTSQVALKPPPTTRPAFLASKPTSQVALKPPPASLPTPWAWAKAEIDAFARKEGFAALSVGIVVEGKLVFSHHQGRISGAKGPTPTDRTLYEIGSLSKPFTAALLMSLHEAGKLRVDDPLRSLGAKIPRLGKASALHAITLGQLAMHTSGLPRLPTNLKPLVSDPYNRYSLEEMWEGLSDLAPETAPGVQYHYSNLGVALLGQLLAAHEKTSFDTLLRSGLLQPLGMKDTVLEAPTGPRSAVAQGFAFPACQTPVASWKLGSLAPAGGMLSSIHDLARFMAFQLGRLQGPISAAGLRWTQTLHAVTSPPAKEGWTTGVGLAWHQIPHGKLPLSLVFHNGRVHGFSSFFGFSPDTQSGVILLANCSKPTDALGFSLLRALVEKRHALAPHPPALVLASQRILKLFQATSASDGDFKIAFHPHFLHVVPATQLRLAASQLRLLYGPPLRLVIEAHQGTLFARARLEFAQGWMPAILALHDTRKAQVQGFRLLGFQPYPSKARPAKR